jgi:ppGpp synthetase/RelA/SpoT-type nucleotidyltranferase
MIYSRKTALLKCSGSSGREALMHDRRVKPSHGYRAVHLVVNVEGHPVEIQIRTPLQHSWASATEKLSDVLDSEIKYGGGPEEIQADLGSISEVCKNYEEVEAHLSILRANILRSSKENDRIDEAIAKIMEEIGGLEDILEEVRKQGGFINYVQQSELVLKERREQILVLLTKVLQSV